MYYVANGSSDNVSGCRVNGITGVLMPLAGSPFPAGSATGLALTPVTSAAGPL
jgi:hypothetical protein